MVALDTHYPDTYHVFYCKKELHLVGFLHNMCNHPDTQDRRMVALDTHYPDIYHSGPQRLVTFYDLYEGKERENEREKKAQNNADDTSYNTT